MLKKKFIKKFTQYPPNESDVIIPIGGDGFLLKCLHDYNYLNIPFYGINYGSIGFLMNNQNGKKLDKIIKVLGITESKRNTFSEECYYYA